MQSLVLTTVTWAQGFDLEREIRNLHESKIPGCYDSGGRVFNGSTCGPYLKKKTLERKAGAEGDLVCCVPNTGIKFMSNGSNDNGGCHGYLVGDGPITSKRQCEVGDRVVGVMEHYASGQYYCCGKNRLAKER